MNTGRTDKNGKSIYVGDICKVPFYRSGSFVNCRVVVTGYKDEPFAWQVSGSGFHFFKEDFKMVEVVGNIKETPHLEYKWCGKTKKYIP